MTHDRSYPRDLVGYGRDPPHAHWPGNARVAVQFVLNYEEGGENGPCSTATTTSEQFLSEIIGAAGVRRAPPVDGVDLRVRLAGRGRGASCASSSGASCR